MRYTISEMASLLGVTTHMLRHYEKMGIIRPEVDESNGYRYYTIIDTRRFNMSRMLHASGIGLTECAEMMNSEFSVTERGYLFAQQLNELKKEQVRLKFTEEYLQEQIELLPVLKQSISKIVIKHYDEPIWRLEFSERETVDATRLIEDERSEWLKMMPVVHWVSRIPYQELVRFSTGEIDYHYGLMITQSKARALGLQRTDHVTVMPGGDYACLLHRKAGRGPWSWEDIKPMTDYLKKRGLKYFGDGFSTVIASYMENGEQVNVHELRVKIIGE